MNIKKITKKVEDTLKEIEVWENKLVNPSKLKKVGNIIGKPIEWIYNMIPEKIENKVTRAIEGSFGILLFASDFLYSNNSIEKRMKKNISSNLIESSKFDYYDIDNLKKTASYYIKENNITAAIEGFGCGLGGFSLILADIPLLFLIAFRVIQQIGLTFNYDMNSLEEKRFIMKIIDLGTCIPTAAKLDTMLGKESLRNYIKKVAFKHMEKIAAAKLGKKSAEEIAKEILRAQGKRATKAAVERMTKSIAQDVAKNGSKAVAVTSARKTAKDIGTRLTRKKIMQLIPLIGGVVGAGFNFSFIWSIGDAAYHAYLKRYIVDNYVI